jgi:thiamine pyrophosphokinase
MALLFVHCYGGALLGIMFTGGEGPSAQAVRRLFDGLDEKPLIAAADSGLEAAEEAGLTPDWIIGDMDSLDDTARLARYPPEVVMRHAADKDYTDTELAFSLLREKGCGEIWILGGGGGRIDHLFAIRSLFERERFPRRWITADADIYCIDAAGAEASAVCADADIYCIDAAGAGASAVCADADVSCIEGGAPNAGLALNLESGALVSVFPLGSGPWRARSFGLKWPLDCLEWNRGFFGVSNVAVSGECRIQAEQGRFMVILPGCNKNWEV